MTLAQRMLVNAPTIFGSQSVHKIMLACVMLAVKMTEDTMFMPQYYAATAGVSVQELAFLEMNTVLILRWNLFVDLPQPLSEDDEFVF